MKKSRYMKSKLVKKKNVKNKVSCRKKFFSSTMMSSEFGVEYAQEEKNPV